MSGWLNELSPYEGEPKSSAGWRLAKAGWRLVRSNRTTLLLVAALAALWTAGVVAHILADFTTPGEGGFFGWLAADVAVLLATTYLLAAIAAVTDAVIDGVPLGPGEALAEAGERRPALIGWALLSLAVPAALVLVFDAVASGMLVTLTVAWFVAGLFAIPFILLAGDGPLGALRASLDLLRRRVRAVTAALLGLFAFTVLGFLPAGAILNHAAALNREGAGTQEVVVIAGVFAVMVVFAASLATREAFAVMLLRESFDDLPGRPFAGRRRTRTKALRLCLGVIGVFVALGVLAAVTEHDREVLDAGRAPGSTYSTLVPGEAGVDLPLGAPVLYEGREIGTVLGSRPDGVHLKVTFHVDPGYNPYSTPGSFEVEETGGRLSLVLQPSTESSPPGPGYY
ncbi:MAG TPA: hypothetical protein VFY69_11595 [Solirubrobacterales bacterium]|nr:hypothetical protein [Solirubrobacterales bacterium]